LQRQGKVIALAWRHCHDDAFDPPGSDYRSNWLFCWMSERGAQKWLREQDGKDRAGLVRTFKTKMRAIGMQPE
jgi:hypothetical protein